MLATTTPDDLVRVGRTAGLRRRRCHALRRGGRGVHRALEGEFVWATGKLAVKRWAASTLDLTESYAYSDSIYDMPLLTSVGHPHAVIPDCACWPGPGRPVADPEPRRATGVPKLLGFEPLEVIRLEPGASCPFARFAFDGADPIPSTAPPSWWPTTGATSTRRGSSPGPRRPDAAVPREEGSVRRTGDWASARRWAVSGSTAALAPPGPSRRQPGPSTPVRWSP